MGKKASNPGPRGKRPVPPPGPPPQEHICSYSRSMDQEYPRKCLGCGKLESDRMYLTYPGYGKTWHIYDSSNGHRALCGKSMMLKVDPSRCESLSDQTYKKGQDCKACFRKAGLLEDK